MTSCMRDRQWTDGRTEYNVSDRDVIQKVDRSSARRRVTTAKSTTC